MNEQERVELEQLKARQARLAAELSQLGGQIRNLELRLERPFPEAPIPVSPAVAPPSPTTHGPVPTPPVRENPPAIRTGVVPVAASVPSHPVIRQQPPLSPVSNAVPPILTVTKLSTAAAETASVPSQESTRPAPTPE